MKNNIFYSRYFTTYHKPLKVRLVIVAADQLHLRGVHEIPGQHRVGQCDRIHPRQIVRHLELAAAHVQHQIRMHAGRTAVQQLVHSFRTRAVGIDERAAIAQQLNCLGRRRRRNGSVDPFCLLLIASHLSLQLFGNVRLDAKHAGGHRLVGATRQIEHPVQLQVTVHVVKVYVYLTIVGWMPAEVDDVHAEPVGERMVVVMVGRAADEVGWLRQRLLLN